MNDQAINDMFNLAKEAGYNGSVEEFKTLLSTNETALSDVFDLAIKNGYQEELSSFSSLMGVKKKDKSQPTSAEEGTASGIPEDVQPGSSDASKAVVDPQSSSLSAPEALDNTLVVPETPPREGEAVADPANALRYNYLKPQDAVDEQRADNYLKRPEESKDAFDRSLDVITDRKHEQVGSFNPLNPSKKYTGRVLTDQEEEEVANELRYHFEEYGFKFEEFGVGDNVRVTSPDGKSTLEIPVDNVLSSKDAKTAKLLRKFLQRHKPRGVDELNEGSQEDRDKILGKKDKEDRIIAINVLSKRFSSDANSYKMERAQLDKEKEQNWETQEAYESWKKRDNTSALEKEKLDRDLLALRRRGAHLDKVVGEYMAMRSNQGTLLGDMHNGIVAGMGQITSMAVSFAVDAAVSGSFQNSTYTDILAKSIKYGKPFSKSNSFSNVASGYVTDERRGLLEHVRGDINDSLGDEDSTRAHSGKSQKESVVKAGLIGIANSIPAMLTSYVGMAMQGGGMAMEEMENTPGFENVSEVEKTAVAASLGVVAAILEKAGLTGALKGTSVLSGVTARLLTRFGARATTKSFSEFVEFEVNSQIMRGGLKLAASALSEFETGAAQEVADIAIKTVYNEVKDQGLFQTPENFEEGLKQVIVAGAMEAVGGALMGSPGALMEGFRKQNFTKVSDATFQAFEALSTDPVTKGAYISKLKLGVASGEMTAKEAEVKMSEFNAMSGLIDRIPSEYSPKAKREALALLLKKDSIIKALEGKDESLVVDKKKQLEIINKRLESLSETEKDAIQKSSAEKVDDKKPTKDSEPVGEGDVSAQPSGESKTEGEGNVAKAEAAEVSDLEAEFGEKRSKEAPKTEKKSFNEPDTAAEPADKTNPLSDEIVSTDSSGKKITRKRTSENTYHISREGGKVNNSIITKATHLAVAKAAKAIKRVLPGVEIITYDDTDLYIGVIGTASKGAYDTRTRRIHIDLSKATVSTVGHEVFHAVLRSKIKGDRNIQAVALDMVFRLRGEIKHPELKKYLNGFIQRYRRAGMKEMMNEEYLAELAGILSQHYSEMNERSQGTVYKWMTNMLDALNLREIKDLIFKKDGSKSVRTREIVDMLDVLARKTATGVEIADSDLKPLNDYAAAVTKYSGTKRILKQLGDDLSNVVVKEVVAKTKKGKVVDTWVYTKKREGDTYTAYSGEINLVAVRENIPASYNTNAAKIGRYNVFGATHGKTLTEAIKGASNTELRKATEENKELVKRKIVTLRKSLAKKKASSAKGLTAKDKKIRVLGIANIASEIQELRVIAGAKTLQGQWDAFVSARESTTKDDIYKKLFYSRGNKILKLTKKELLEHSDGVYKGAISIVKRNLKGVYDSVSPKVRGISKLWYDGANIIAQDMASKYGVTLEQAAGIIATQSPQKQWFDNLHLADVIMDTLANHGDDKYAQEDLDHYIKGAAGYPAQRALIPELKKHIGVTLKDLPNGIASAYIRSTFDRRIRRKAPIRIPTGATISSDNSSDAAFNGYAVISKAVSIFRNGDVENISIALGAANKVRNFYVNIVDPSNPNAVTIDTHAIAIALFKPLGASANEVDFSPAAFALYAQAYRELAGELGIEARSLQSITWEAARAIFPGGKKKQKNYKENINKDWDAFQEGTLTLEEVYKNILDKAENPNQTEWLDHIEILKDAKRRTNVSGRIVRLDGDGHSFSLGGRDGVDSSTPAKGGGNTRNNTVSSKKVGGKLYQLENDVSIKEYLSEQEFFQKTNSFSWAVDEVSEADLKKSTIREYKGTLGIVTEDGDMKGLFNPNVAKLREGKVLNKGTLKGLFPKLIEAGGIKMDNYDGKLTEMYEANGFRVTSRTPFNPEYAPDGWVESKHGTPDVVAMLYDPNSEMDIEERTFEGSEDSYDDMIRYRDSLISKKDSSSKTLQQLDDKGNDLSSLKEDPTYSNTEFIPKEYNKTYNKKTPVNPAKLPNTKFEVSWNAESRGGYSVSRSKTFRDKWHFVNWWRKVTNDGQWDYLYGLSAITDTNTTINKVQKKDGSWTKITVHSLTSQEIDADLMKSWKFKSKIEPQRIPTPGAAPQYSKYTSMYQLADDSLSANEIVQQARAKGYRDTAIYTYLVKRRGFKAVDIKAALEVKPDMFTAMPKSFGDVKGGAKAGAVLFGKISAFMKKEVLNNQRRTKLSFLEVDQKVREFKKSLSVKVKTAIDIIEEVRRFRKKLERSKKPGSFAEINAKVKSFKERQFRLRDKTKAEIEVKTSKFKKTETAKNNKRKAKLSMQEIMDLAIEFMEKQKEYVAESDVRVVKGKEVRMQEMSHQQAKMQSELQKSIGERPTKDMVKKLRAARVLIKHQKKGKRDIQAIKRALRNFIRQTLPPSAYTKNDVMSMVSKVAGATDENIENVMEQVVEFATKKNVGVLSGLINKILDSKYEVTQSGRKKGVKISLKARKQLKQIASLTIRSKATAEEVLLINAELLERYSVLANQVTKTEADISDMLSIQVAMNYNNALLMANTDLRKVEVLDSVLQTITKIQEGGKIEMQALLEAKHAAFKESFEYLFKDITGLDVDIDSDSFKEEIRKIINEGENTARAKKAKGAIHRFFNGIMEAIHDTFTKAEAIDGLMDKISSLTGDILGGRAQELVTERLNEASIVNKKHTMANDRLLKAKMKEFFGRRWSKVSRKNKVETATGVYLDNEAVMGARKNGSKEALAKAILDNEIILSPNQVYYLYNQYKDPAVRLAFKAKFGEESERIMEELEATLSPELKAFADWQTDTFFPSLYNRYNEVYKSVYLTDMPWNEHYSGRLYREVEGIDDGIFSLLSGTTADNWVTAASTKARTQNNNAIKTSIDGTDALFSYLSDMEHFHSHAVVVGDINRLLLNKNMKAVIKALHGKGTVEVIEAAIRTIATNAVNPSGKKMWLVNAMNTAFIVSRLGVNPVVMIKQLTSFLTYGNEIGYANWVGSAVKSMGSLRSSLREIKENSIYMNERRYSSITKVLETYSKGSMQSFVPRPALNFMVDLAMWFTKTGDKAAIYIGGIPNYVHYKSQFMKANPKASEQAAIDYAIKKFERDTKQTQQSGDLQDKDYFQTKDGITKAFNMFMTTPKQYLRKEIKSIRNLYRKISQWDSKAGKGGVGENLRTFVVYHVVMPVFFQFVASGFPLGDDLDDEDKDDMLRAALLGNLNALFIVGNMISALGDYFTDKPWASSAKSIPALEMVGQMIKKKERADKTKDPEKKAKYEREFFAELFSLTGVPAANLLKAKDNYDKIQGGGLSPKETALRALNYSDYVIGRKEDKPGKGALTKAEKRRYFPELYEELEELREAALNDEYLETQEEVERMNQERKATRKQLLNDIYE